MAIGVGMSEDKKLGIVKAKISKKWLPSSYKSADVCPEGLGIGSDDFIKYSSIEEAKLACSDIHGERKKKSLLVLEDKRTVVVNHETSNKTDLWRLATFTAAATGLKLLKSGEGRIEYKGTSIVYSADSVVVDGQVFTWKDLGEFDLCWCSEREANPDRFKDLSLFDGMPTPSPLKNRKYGLWFFSLEFPPNAKLQEKVSPLVPFDFHLIPENGIENLYGHFFNMEWFSGADILFMPFWREMFGGEKRPREFLTRED